jgi:DNA-binding transcriptional LysR family regulator
MSPSPLPHIETFCRVAELGSFTAAAKEAGVTQAAISQRIHALERSLRASLFDRSGGRILLTESGRRLYQYAQRILELHREARQAIHGQMQPVTGELLLAASSVPGDFLLPAVLSNFRRQHPAIQVRATVHDSMEVMDQVGRARAHLGLVGRKAQSPHLEFRPFATDELLLAVPLDHRWKRRKRISLGELAKEPLILRERGSGSRWCFEQALAHVGKSLDDLTVAFEFGSNEAIKGFVMKGSGVAVLSDLALQQELNGRRLHALRVRELPLRRTLFAVLDRRSAVPAPARLFLNFLEAYSGEPAAP